ncbi:hypothetical protein HY991_03630, partial [Candidatus Micrarchaeota archaeon]|nr:hypothetical protein [Candidatus Micrarchaeota archaeon]
PEGIPEEIVIKLNRFTLKGTYSADLKLPSNAKLLCPTEAKFKGTLKDAPPKSVMIPPCTNKIEVSVDYSNNKDFEETQGLFQISMPPYISQPKDIPVAIMLDDSPIPQAMQLMVNRVSLKDEEAVYDEFTVQGLDDSKCSLKGLSKVKAKCSESAITFSTTYNGLNEIGSGKGTLVVSGLGDNQIRELPVFVSDRPAAISMKLEKKSESSFVAKYVFPSPAEKFIGDVGKDLSGELLVQCDLRGLAGAKTKSPKCVKKSSEFSIEISVEYEKEQSDAGKLVILSLDKYGKRHAIEIPVLVNKEPGVPWVKFDAKKYLVGKGAFFYITFKDASGKTVASKTKPGGIVTVYYGFPEGDLKEKREIHVYKNYKYPPSFWQYSKAFKWRPVDEGSFSWLLPKDTKSGDKFTVKAFAFFTVEGKEVMKESKPIELSIGRDPPEKENTATAGLEDSTSDETPTKKPSPSPSPSPSLDVKRRILGAIITKG